MCVCVCSEVLGLGVDRGGGGWSAELACGGLLDRCRSGGSAGKLKTGAALTASGDNPR